MYVHMQIGVCVRPWVYMCVHMCVMFFYSSFVYLVHVQLHKCSAVLLSVVSLVSLCVGGGRGGGYTCVYTMRGRCLAACSCTHPVWVGVPCRL